MTASLQLSWREGASAKPGPDGAWCIEGPGGRVVLRNPAPALAAALLRLTPPGEDEDRIVDDILTAGGPEALAGWYFRLQGLAGRGFVSRSAQIDGRRLATLLPTTASFRFSPTLVPPDCPHLLSRFAYLRREGSTLVLESPLSHARVLLDDSRSALLVAALATPGTVHELAGRANGLPAEAILPLLGLLAGAGMIEEFAPDRSDERAESAVLRSWEFHDLLFHARSRKGRSDAPSGATYRLAGVTDPPPALKPPEAGEVFELHRPDLSRLERDDPPLARIMEHRQSVREYGPRPITATQLGEFLFRVARAKDFYRSEVDTPRGPVQCEYAPRPYPSGGGLYEIEFYAAVHTCDGLEPGLYRYEPRGHRLGLICRRNADVERLLRDAALSAGIPGERVQVVLILAARFGRLAWKYASISYSLVLKHVGVIYQSMYLAATAMNLSPCALGGGDSDLFARAAGTDYYEETSVGEFLIGSHSVAGAQEDRTG